MVLNSESPGRHDEAPDQFSPKETCTEEEIHEAIAGVLIGDLTLAQLDGRTVEELYFAADIGYDLYSNGLLDEAGVVFRGLVAYNPRDAYFHAMLGAIAQRADDPVQAAGHYEKAVELLPDNANSWANLGEVRLLLSGKLQAEGESAKAVSLLEQAVVALRKAIELDPAGANGTSLRARALLRVTVSALTPQRT